MSSERIEAVASNAVEFMKSRLDDKHTFIVMVADDKGGWAVRWNIAHPLAAIGLAKLGLNALETPAMQKDAQKQVAP